MSLDLFTTVFRCGVCDAPAHAWTDWCPDGARLRYEYTHTDDCPAAEDEQP